MFYYMNTTDLEAPGYGSQTAFGSCIKNHLMTRLCFDVVISIAEPILCAMHICCDCKAIGTSYIKVSRYVEMQWKGGRFPNKVVCEMFSICLCSIVSVSGRARESHRVTVKFFNLCIKCYNVVDVCHLGCYLVIVPLAPENILFSPQRK